MLFNLIYAALSPSVLGYILYAIYLTGEIWILMTIIDSSMYKYVNDVSSKTEMLVYNNVISLCMPWADSVMNKVFKSIVYLYQPSMTTWLTMT